MILYYPNAECKVNGAMETQRLFTQTAYTTEEAAMEQIRFWRDEYRFDIQRAWIGVMSTKGDEKAEIDVTEQLFSDGRKGV